MSLFNKSQTTCPRYAVAPLSACLLFCASATWAAGTRVGTLIESTASIDFTQNGEQRNAQSNIVTFVVAERLDVALTRQSGPVVVSPSDVERALRFTVTNL